MIHARQDGDGKIRFRIWDSSSRKYTTGEMSSEELRNELIKGKVEEFLLNLLEWIDTVTEITARRGFGPQNEDSPDRTLESPWEDEDKG